MLYRHQAPGKGARPGRCSGTAMTARATDCTTVRLYDEAADLTCHQQTCFKVTGKSIGDSFSPRRHGTRQHSGPPRRTSPTGPRVRRPWRATQPRRAPQRCPRQRHCIVKREVIRELRQKHVQRVWRRPASSGVVPSTEPHPRVRRHKGPAPPRVSAVSREREHSALWTQPSRAGARRRAEHGRKRGSKLSSDSDRSTGTRRPPHVPLSLVAPRAGLLGLLHGGIDLLRLGGRGDHDATSLALGSDASLQGNAGLHDEGGLHIDGMTDVFGGWFVFDCGEPTEKVGTGLRNFIQPR